MTLWLEGLDGIRLAASAFGPADGRPVIMTGGLGQTRHGWTRAAERIGASGMRAIALDLRGHGESEWSPDGRYDYARTAGDLVAVVRTIGRPAVLVGASLGGKISLTAAGQGGPRVACSLIIVDTVPRTNPSGVAEATRILRPPPTGFASLDEAPAELARVRGTPAGCGERLRRHMRTDAAGRWHWHWDPAWMEGDQGIGLAAATEFLENAARELRVPVLLTRGELSNVVDDDGVAAFRALVPHVEVETIAGAGHMIVGDCNDAFADAVIRFLERTSM